MEDLLKTHQKVDDKIFFFILQFFLRITAHWYGVAVHLCFMFVKMSINFSHISSHFYHLNYSNFIIFSIFIFLILFISQMLVNLCVNLYDILRPLIIHIYHLETLAELCMILKTEMIDDHVHSNCQL